MCRRGLGRVVADARLPGPARADRARLALARHPHLGVQGRLSIHSASLLRRAHRLGVRVVVWTVDDSARMHELLDMGVDGIITDRPDVLRSVMIGRGVWTPMGETSERSEHWGGRPADCR